MNILQKSFLLFALNLLDALLTLIWVRNHWATEGNQLMAGLLDIGDAPFLTVKLLIGAVAAYVFFRWGNFKVARYGLSVALVVYIGLMGIHFVTALSAMGYEPERALNFFSEKFLAIIFLI